MQIPVRLTVPDAGGQRSSETLARSSVYVCVCVERFWAVNEQRGCPRSRLSSDGMNGAGGGD